MWYHLEATFLISPKSVSIEVLPWLSQGSIHSAKAPLLWNVFYWILLCERMGQGIAPNVCVWYIVWSRMQYGTPITETALRCFLFFFHIRRNVLIFRMLEWFFFDFWEVENLEIVTRALHDLKIFNNDWVIVSFWSKIQWRITIK